MMKPLLLLLLQLRLQPVQRAQQQPKTSNSNQEESSIVISFPILGNASLKKEPAPPVGLFTSLPLSVKVVLRVGEIGVCTHTQTWQEETIF